MAVPRGMVTDRRSAWGRQLPGCSGGRSLPWRRPEQPASVDAELRRRARRRSRLAVCGRTAAVLRRLLLAILGELHRKAGLGEGKAHALIRGGPHHARTVLILHGGRSPAAAPRASRD